MSLIEKSLANYLGVEYAGREMNFLSISGQQITGFETIVPIIEIDNEVLRYEAMAVVEILSVVKELLRRNKLDENIIVRISTLERANMVPDTSTGDLEKVKSFIL